MALVTCTNKYNVSEDLVRNSAMVHSFLAEALSYYGYYTSIWYYWPQVHIHQHVLLGALGSLVIILLQRGAATQCCHCVVMGHSGSDLVTSVIVIIPMVTSITVCCWGHKLPSINIDAIVVWSQWWWWTTWLSLLGHAVIAIVFTTQDKYCHTAGYLALLL